MNNKCRPWVVLAVALVMTACAGSAVAPSLSPSTTVAVPPTVQTTAPPVITTTSASDSPTVIIPWGPAGDRAYLTVMLLDGWQALDGFVRKSVPDDRPNFMRLGSSTVGNIYSEPCRSTLLDPPVGPTVDELATAFTDVVGLDATAPTEVTLDGFVGRQMVLTVPADADFADCVTGRFMAWSEEGITTGSRWLQGPGQILETWIVDVEGQRLLIEASYFPELSRGDRAELQQVIDSIQIVTE